MADITWIKITTNMFEDEKMRLIDAMPERDTIHYIWMRLLVQAGKTNANGFIYLNEDMAYTDEMLATLFCRPLSSIRLALKTLTHFKMIEIDDDNYIRIVNWEKHQNTDGMDRVRELNRKRVQKYREKKKLLKENDEESDGNVIVMSVTEQNKREIKNKTKNKIKNKKENDKEKDISLSLDKSLTGDSVSQESINLLKEFEIITGIPDVLSLGSIKLAIDMHGIKYVRKAMTKALEVNKLNMTYVNGILRNWRKEGYPKEEEVNNGRDCRSNSKENTAEFGEFKATQPRRLTKSELTKTAAELI